MQYRIEGSLEHIKDLAKHVFNEYPCEIKNNELIIESADHTVTFLSMIKIFLQTSVSVDYKTHDLIKFVVL